MDLSLSAPELERLIGIAAGRQEADLVLRGGRVVNTFTGEVLEADVAIAGDRIAGVGEYRAKNTVDLRGCLLCPGFIDAHVHLESAMVTVPEYARAVVPHGTSTVVADPHEIANVLGTEGIGYLLRSSKYNPLHVFVMLPSCVPATPLETSGADLSAIDLFPYLQDRWVLGMGEVMNYPGVVAGDEEVLDKLRVTTKGRVDGHAPGLSGRELNAYASAGIESDHECTTVEEAREKLRAGMTVMLREGSATRNLRDLLPAASWETADRICFCTDDKHPEDLLSEGHIDHMIRIAVGAGVPGPLAVRMATLSAARYFGLERRGAIAPGWLADMVVMDDFESARVRQVYKLGRMVAEDGAMISAETPLRQITPRGSVNVKWLHVEDFEIPAGDGSANVIDVVENQIFTRHSVEDVKREDGRVVADFERDVLPLFVIERHKASGRIGRGLVRGFGLKRGALASSVAHDSHNLIAVGANPRDVFEAVVHLVRMQGGQSVFADGCEVASLPLPIAGLMSPAPLLEVVQLGSTLRQAARDCGAHPADPFMTLSFLALPVIPELKLTDSGLVHVTTQRVLPLFNGAGG